jgi:hypothetical protein
MPTFFVVIGETALVEPQPSSENSTRLHPVFSSLDFATIIFYRARSSALRPTPNMEDQLSLYLCPPSDRVVRLYPQAPGSLLLAFYESQGNGGGILMRLHMGDLVEIKLRTVERRTHTHTHTHLYRIPDYMHVI